LKQILVPVVCLSLMAPTLPAHATALPRPGIGAGNGIVLIDRRGHYGRHHHHGGVGAAGIIGAIIAGTLIAAAIREGRARHDDIERCAEDFPDFDPETGTYINRHGEERVCPYLR
jgi:hypothetical protein